MDIKKCFIITAILLFPKFGIDATPISEFNAQFIKQSILRLKPDFSQKDATIISKVVFKYAKFKDLDPLLIISIMYQESRFKLKVVSKTSDYCAMQINIANIKRHKLNSDKLLTDYDYCIYWGAKILHGFKNVYSQKEFFWWSRYNSPLPEWRKKYEKSVLSHYNIIHPEFFEINSKHAFAHNVVKTNYEY